jgi:hypothetical protein
MKNDFLMLHFWFVHFLVFLGQRSKRKGHSISLTYSPFATLLARNVQSKQVGDNA